VSNLQPYEDWLEESRVKMIAEYDRLKFRASGNYANTLEPVIESTFDYTRVKMLGSAYAEQMQFGRGKTQNTGTGQVKEGIIKWVADRGITPRDAATSVESMIFMIVRAIHRRGYTVAGREGVISNVITPEWINNLVSRAGVVELGRVTSDILRLVKEIQNGN
jgi:hypothetical protein